MFASLSRAQRKQILNFLLKIEENSNFEEKMTINDAPSKYGQSSHNGSESGTGEPAGLSRRFLFTQPRQAWVKRAVNIYPAMPQIELAPERAGHSLAS